MNRELARTLLRWLLIVSGLFLVLAFAAVPIPSHWMGRAHHWLGLGEFPLQAITLYLARSTSLLYGVHGTMMFYTGVTIENHWRLVPLFGWLHVVIGLTMLAIDLSAPMPIWWTVIEGVPVAILGVVILLLYQQGFVETD